MSQAAPTDASLGDLTVVHSLNPLNILTVIFCAILTSSISELATWYIVYRKDQYKILKQNIETQQAKLDKAQDVYCTISQNAANEKKVAAIDRQLKSLNSDMSSYKMKSTLLIAVFMIATLQAFGTYFAGTIVAKLPYIPFSLLTNLSHRGIEGDDLTDCAYIFIYVQMAYIWRTNVQKAFGFEPPKQANPWGQPPAWGAK